MTKLNNAFPVDEKSSMQNGQLLPVNRVKRKDEIRFLKLLEEYSFGIDQKGIYQVNQKGMQHIADFFNITYLYNKMIGNERIRVIKIDGTVFEITPNLLINPNAFRRLLFSANYNLICSTKQFNELMQIITKLDNGKIINSTRGYGKIADNIYNFGNKLLVNKELIDYQKNIWLGKKGYSIKKTDMLHITKNTFNPSQLWNSFFELYGMQAVLIIGFAVASLYFKEYMKKEKRFPLLYIKAGSGRGKNGLTDLIENLFGIKHPFASINFACNSTKIGIETKAILLNNLPLFLNELSEHDFEFIKSRYDGQGSVKYSDFNPENFYERTVNGSTIITTVVEPKDKQIISRCVFVNLDITDMKKKTFDNLRKISKKFSQFSSVILKNFSFEQIIYSIEKFKDNIDCAIVQPRICDNYSLIAGCFLAFTSLFTCKNDLPDSTKIKEFIINEMKTTENFLNPLIYFIRELERLSEYPKSEKFITQDDKFMYFNFNGVWSIITNTFKKKYFPFITPSFIKKQLKYSKFIAHYGKDFTPDENHHPGKPVNSFHKHIKNTTRRCFVLQKSELLNFYK